MPLERRIQIEFVAGDVAIANRPQGKSLEAFEQALGLDSSVRLDVPNHDIGAAGPCGARGFEHGVGLADTSRGAEKDPQAPTPGAGFLRLDMSEQLVGIGPRFRHGVDQAHLSMSSARLSSNTLTRGSPS